MNKAIVLCAVMTLVLTLGLSAATVIPVSGGGVNAIGTALAGAGPADIIEITDSLVYQEAPWAGASQIDGRSVRAAARQTPIIQCTGAGPGQPLINWNGNLSSQFGDNSLGRITVDLNTVSDAMIINWATGGPGLLRVENIDILGGPGHGGLVTVTTAGGGGNGRVEINNCDFNGLDQAYFAVWHVGGVLATSETVITGSRFTDFVDGGGFFAILEINDGTLQAGYSAFGTIASNEIENVYRTQAGSPQLSFDHCDLVNLTPTPSRVTLDNTTSTATFIDSILLGVDGGVINFAGVVNSSYTDVFAPVNVGYVPGTGDLAVDPLYVGGSPFDFTPTAAAVLTGDSTGGPMGSGLGTGTSQIPVELSVFTAD